MATKGLLDHVNDTGQWGAFNLAERALDRAARKGIETWQTGANDGIALLQAANNESGKLATKAERDMVSALDDAIQLAGSAIGKPRELLIKIRAIHFLLAEGKVEEAKVATFAAMWHLDNFGVEPAERAAYDYAANYYDK